MAAPVVVTGTHGVTSGTWRRISLLGPGIQIVGVAKDWDIGGVPEIRRYGADRGGNGTPIGGGGVGEPDGTDLCLRKGGKQDSPAVFLQCDIIWIVLCRVVWIVEIAIKTIRADGLLAILWIRIAVRSRGAAEGNCHRSRGEVCYGGFGTYLCKPDI